MAGSADHFTVDHPQNQDYGRRNLLRRRKRLSHLLRSDPNYAILQRNFFEGWKHPNKQKPYIHSIFKILSSEASLDAFHGYRARVAAHPFCSTQNSANEQLLFHGTTRCCLLGEDKSRIRLCDGQRCLLCRVIDQSFDMVKCGTENNFSRFGKGIYTTACSSKADDYTENMNDAGTLRVLLVNRVIVGNPHQMYRNGTNLTGPPSGYHSVIGTPGIDLNYEETVVYSNDAIRPAFLIVYGDYAS